VSAGGSRASKEGGTFRVAVPIGTFGGIDPAFGGGVGSGQLLRTACEALVSYPNKPPPEGLRLASELAQADPVVSKDGKTYTFTVRKNARFSTGAPLTARAFARALERILDPAMGSLLCPRLPGHRRSAGRHRGQGDDNTRGHSDGQDAGPQADETPARSTGPPGGSLRGALQPACGSGGCEGTASEPGAVLREGVCPGRAARARAKPFLSRRTATSRRPHRRRAELGPNSIIDRIASGNLDWGPIPANLAQRGAELAQRYGVNRSQFFVKPGHFVRMFVLNTSRPLFRNNVKLRRALNLAVDRAALARELGPYGATPTDQYLRYRNARIYPLEGPDLRTARKLAEGRTRGGKAVLYTSTSLIDAALTQIVQQNLEAIGLDVEVKTFRSRSSSRSWRRIGSSSISGGSPLGTPSARWTRPS
jgi:ABC-type transport system substrate-binding protein